MRATSKTWFGSLAKVFSNDPENKDRTMMHAMMAKLCVIYEDLRLEVAALYDEDFLKERITAFTDEARLGYFGRRCLATLNEFSEVVVALDSNPEFVKQKTKLSPRHLDEWDNAVTHFKDQKHELRNVRNDIGAHFTIEAAKFAIEAFDKAEHGEYADMAPAVGSIEVRHPTRTLIRTKQGRLHFPYRLHFANHIAMAATIKRSKLKGSPREQADELVNRLLVRSQEHAYKAAGVILFCYLLPRFRV